MPACVAALLASRAYLNLCPDMKTSPNRGQVIPRWSLPSPRRRLVTGSKRGPNRPQPANYSCLTGAIGRLPDGVPVAVKAQTQLWSFAVRTRLDLLARNRIPFLTVHPVKSSHTGIPTPCWVRDARPPIQKDETNLPGP